MSNQRTVTLTSGVPTAPSGTVSSLDQLMDFLSYQRGYSSGMVTVTRPANTTAYSAYDVIGDVTNGGVITFPTIGPSAGGEVELRRAFLEIDISALPTGMTTFDFHLYNVTPPSAIIDNAQFDIPSGDRAGYLGKLTFGTPILPRATVGSTMYASLDSFATQVTVLSGGNLFGYLVTPPGFTPANNSEVYKIGLKSVGLGVLNAT